MCAATTITTGFGAAQGCLHPAHGSLGAGRGGDPAQVRHLAAQHLVAVPRAPATVREAAASVLVRATEAQQPESTIRAGIATLADLIGPR